MLSGVVVDLIFCRVGLSGLSLGYLLSFVADVFPVCGIFFGSAACFGVQLICGFCLVKRKESLISD